MKISKESYDKMFTAIALLDRQGVLKHADTVKADGGYKDFSKRMRWDLSYKANLSGYICDVIYPQGCDDSHVDTALKSIVKALGYQF